MHLRDGKYWQESIWRRGKVTTRYLGLDCPHMRDLARLDDLAREEDRARREEARAERRRHEAALSRSKQTAEIIDILAIIAVNAAGYHKPRRHRWRKIRMRIIESPKATEAQARKRVRDLVKGIGRLAEDPGRLAKRRPLVDELRDIGEAHPAVLIDECNGDLARIVIETYGQGPFADAGCPEWWEAVVARTRQLRAELIAGSPSAAVGMMADVAVVAWLEFWLASEEHRQAGEDGRPSAALERRLTWCQMRYTRALRSVEELRRLTAARRTPATSLTG
jgi:hypothetical protein